MVFLAPDKPGITPGVPVNAEGLAIFEVEEGDYSLTVTVPKSKCFKMRFMPYYVVGNTTQGKVIRLKNYCVA